MEFFQTILYFLITIGVLVFVHELGHFLAAIACGMRAEVFALGMGNRVFGWNRITKFTFGKLKEGLDLEGNTDYRLAAFPIGGYVKIAGMVDESLDTNFQNSEPQPWEYRAKPVWKRMIVISAGVIMNILLAIGIFWGINYVQGDSFMQTTEIGAVIHDSPAAKAGLHAGDKILSVNNKKIEHWEAIQKAIYFDFLGEDIVLNAERTGVQQVFIISRSNIPDITEMNFGIIPPHTEVLINEVLPGNPAERAGLKVDDVILSINEQEVFTREDVVKILKANILKPVAVKIKRNNEIKILPATPSKEGLIGIKIENHYTGPLLTVHQGLFESFPKAVTQTFNSVFLLYHSLKQIIVGNAEFSKSIGGPIKIAEMAGKTSQYGFGYFVSLLAMLSISLAVLNILPFPALDGGHLIMLIYEMLVRKPLPHIVQIRIQQVGMVILLGFMMFVLYNDIFG